VGLLGFKKVFAKFVSEKIEIGKCLAKLQARRQEDGCLVHFVHLATTLQKDKESAQNNHVLARNFAKFSRILIMG